MDAQRLKVATAIVSVLSNTMLVVLKLVVGLVIGSVAVVSEAIHSGIDLLAAAIALIAVHLSGRPSDHDHPFGHGKFENVAGTVEALLIVGAAGWIGYEAIRKLIHPVPVEFPGWGVLVMLVSVMANLAVSELLFRVARATNSVALQADGWHLRTDVYTSLGVLIGLACLALGDRWWPGLELHWIDPLAALLVAMLILKAGFELTFTAGRDLVDASLPAAEVQLIRDLGVECCGEGHSIHALRTRKSGAARFVDLHLELPPTMTVAESHAIADHLEETIRCRLPDSSVTIHVEPIGRIRKRPPGVAPQS